MIEAERKVGGPLPPGPEGRLVAGNLPEYARDQPGFLTWCAKEYGDGVRLRFFNVRVFMLNRPDYIEHVPVGNHRNFMKDRAERSGLRVLGDGLLTSEGEFWRRRRRLAQPVFHRERINAHGETMVEAILLLATIRGGSGSGLPAARSRRGRRSRWGRRAA